MDKIIPVLTVFDFDRAEPTPISIETVSRSIRLIHTLFITDIRIIGATGIPFDRD